MNDPTRVAEAARWKLGEPAYNTGSFGVSSAGNLTIQDNAHTYDVTALAKEYGTPLEIFLPDVLTSRIRTVQDAFAARMQQQDYEAAFSYYYPMKVNQRKEFVAAAVSAGAQLETSSANELALVRELVRAGEAPKSLRISCNGPKTREYLDLIRRMHDDGFPIIPIIEDLEEMHALSDYPGSVGVRVDPEVKVKAHWDKKYGRFGIPERVLREMDAIPNLVMLSYHISSQIPAVEPFTKVLDHTMHLYAHLQEKNPALSTLNIGGGASIPYQKRPFYSTDELVAAITEQAKRSADAIGVKGPDLICEWGQHIAAPAQFTVFTVIGHKGIAGASAKEWYVIDGSFIANLPDTWSIHQDWHVAPVNRMDASAETAVWFAGSSCDSDDEYVTRELTLMPQLSPDEPQLLAFFDTGAYQDSLSSHHCLLSHPARLIINGSQVTLAREKESPRQAAASFGW